MSSNSEKIADKQKLGLVALVAIVVSSMIGSGVDSLPQNMAANSAVGPVVIAWLVCGFGMFFIARTFIVLSEVRPDLDSGIYMYSREGFGPFIAFIVAWGYWLMIIFSNVAFAIMVMDVLNYFFPGDFQGGNNFASIIGASVLIWGFNFLVLSGSRVSGLVDTIGTIAKLIPLIFFVFVLVYFLRSSQLTSDIWGHSSAIEQNNLGSTLSQILSPLDVALWCFIGIEGAIALSGRAKNKKDIGKATLIGFIISLSICVLVSILPFGVLPQSELKNIATPSTAGVLKILTGEWGEWFINVGVLISVLSSWVAWTMICAEIPMVAGKNGTFPKIFAKVNKYGSASVSLWISSILMQLTILLVYFSNNAWLTMLDISAITVLPAYLGSTAYLFKLCITSEFSKYSNKSRVFALISSVIGAIFCLFMFYASNIQYVAMVPIILTCGLPLYFWACREANPNKKIIWQKYEKIYLAILFILDIITITLFATGIFQL